MMFFAVYVGSSMAPTLRDAEIIEIMPYGSRPLRAGDVIFFSSAEADRLVVHRIKRVTHAGIVTLGDNNARKDAFLLQPKNIKGRVVAAWRGQKRRKISGGLRGKLTGGWLRWQHAIDRRLSSRLHPLYRALSNKGSIAWAMPVSSRPHVVVFNARGHDQFQLLLGRRRIGQYDDQEQQWRIQRPFRLWVNESRLPRPQERASLERRNPIKGQRS